jgi:CheY-like chemotaxis protein
MDITEAPMPAILVVDDDADTCRDLADLFGDLGYVVDAAEGNRGVARTS